MQRTLTVHKPLEFCWGRTSNTRETLRAINEALAPFAACQVQPFSNPIRVILLPVVVIVSLAPVVLTKKKKNKLACLSLNPPAVQLTSKTWRQCEKKQQKSISREFPG